MTQIVDGKRIADNILQRLKRKIKDLPDKPRLVVFLVGKNKASVSYVEAKRKKAGEIGIGVELKRFADNISQADLQKKIRETAGDDSVHGILVQLPLPEEMNKQEVLDTVPPHLDVDALTAKNKLDIIERGQALFVPPAASAVLAILDEYGVELADKNVVIVGTGDLVGKPLAALLLNREVNFELANQYTKNLPKLLMKADVVVSGVGKEGLIRGEMIKEGAVVIDAGTTGSETGDLSGDVDFESVEPKASLLSPVPGGVGPLTIAQLFVNVVKSAKRLSGS